MIVCCCVCSKACDRNLTEHMGSPWCLFFLSSGCWPGVPDVAVQILKRYFESVALCVLVDLYVADVDPRS